MLTLSVSKFKATCLAVIDRIQKTGETVMITKHGKPAAVISPPPHGDTATRPHFGMYKDQIKITGDIISPLDPVVWEVSDDPI